MNNLKPCPNCLQGVDIIAINRKNNENNQTFYFVNCEKCGFGSKNAYLSRDVLIEHWNESLEKQQGVVNA